MSVVLVIGGGMLAVLGVAAAGLIGDELTGWVTASITALTRNTARVLERAGRAQEAQDLIADFDGETKSSSYRPVWTLMQALFWAARVRRPAWLRLVCWFRNTPDVECSADLTFGSRVVRLRATMPAAERDQLRTMGVDDVLNWLIRTDPRGIEAVLLLSDATDCPVSILFSMDPVHVTRRRRLWALVRRGG